MAELTNKEKCLLQIIPKDLEKGKGFNELFEVTRVFSDKDRIGSLETFVNALQKLKNRGFIDWVKPKAKGRTHKSVYYRTRLGNQHLKSATSQIKFSTGIGELTLLKNLVAHPILNDSVIIYSNIPLFSLLEKDKLEDLVHKGQVDTNRIISEVEWLLLNRFTQETFGRPQEAQARRHCELDFLQIRYEGSGRCKNMRENRRVQRKIDERIEQLRTQHNQPITYEDIKYEDSSIYHQFEDFPLTMDEYNKYRTLKRESRKVNKAYERFKRPLAVLVCNEDFMEELVLHGPAVELRDHSITLPQEAVKHLKDKELQQFEAEVREAVVTDKHANTITEVQKNEQGEVTRFGFILGPDWPRKDDPKGIAWPPFAPLFERDWHRDSKKGYFRKVYDAILEEMKRRGIRRKSEKPNR